MESSKGEESEKLFILHESTSEEGVAELAESMNNLSLSNHPWRNLYLIAPSITEDQGAISKCTLRDVQNFRDESKNVWKHEKREENPSKVPRKTENSSNQTPSCPYAFYSVISSGAKFSILTPIFKEVVGDDRQDLQIVHLNQNAKDTLNPGFIKLQDHPVGRILCITKLQRKSEIDGVSIDNFKFDENEEENVLCSNAKYFWEVNEFFALPKDTAVNVRTAQKELESLETLFDGKRSRKEAYQALQQVIELGSTGVFSIRNQMIDPALYTTRISNCEEEDTSVYFNFNINKGSLEKWNKSIRIMITYGKEKLAAEVLDATDEILWIRVKARSYVCPSELMLLNEVIVQQKPEFEPKKVPYNVPEGSNADNLIQALYGGSPLPPLPKIEPILPIKFGSFALLETQTKYAQLMSDTRISALVGSSSFGCGKTATIAAAALHGLSTFPDSFQVVTAVTNCAIVAVIEKIEQLCPNAGIVRIISPENMMEIPSNLLTKYDYPTILVDLLKDVLKSLDFFDDSFLEQSIAYLKAKGVLKEKSLKLESLRDLYHSAVKYSEEKLLEYVMMKKKPSIIVGTVQSIITAFFHTWELYSSRVVAVQIDESSTLNREALIHVAIRFPHARFALVGDHRQLAPFCEREVSTVLREVAIGNTLEDCINKNFPSVFFNGVFRCRPEITELLGDLFYDSKLVSLYIKCETERQLRNFPLREIQNYPMVFIDTEESSQKGCGTSLKNEKEAETAMCLADKLTRFVDKSKIAILCFYKAQIKEFDVWSQKSGVYVGSVDSGQGREWPICIICTTRTTAMNKCEFLIDSRRINVALSRSRNLNFVLGRKASMDNANNWKTIIKKCEIKDNSIKSNYLYRILNKEPAIVHRARPKQMYCNLLDFPNL